MPEVPPGKIPEHTVERAYLALGAVALASLALGLWQIRTSIRLPFVLVANSNVNDSSANSVAEVPDDIQALKNKDTDGDGLSDYDELYLYHTSPYLKDTDSDGYDDKTEILSGNDPNCPTDKTCGPVSNPAGTGTTTPTPAQIREVLKKNGATDDVLAKYDDATLLQLYREVAGEGTPATGEQTMSGTPSPTTPAPALTPEQQSIIKQMPGAELRKFLIDGGADKTLLDRFDDTTLKSIVNQALGL